MELKTKYQYTYFIYPYLVDKNKINKYIYALLKTPQCKLKIFDKFQDTDIYTYFLPKVRDYMFPTFDFNKEKINKLNELDYKMMATLLSRYPCMMFDYKIEEDIQGKVEDKEGIFFNINDVKIICFNTGICFMLIKTILDKDSNLSEVCNFNYKFRDIKSEVNKLYGFENIKIQTNLLKDSQDILTLIKRITGNNTNLRELNINSDRFFTYSYACVDQEDWQKSSEEGTLSQEFYKFSHVLPSDSSVFVRKEDEITEKESYKYGISSSGVTLLASDVDINNYTKMLHKFENEFLYNYIFYIYKKVYIKQISKKFSKNSEEFVNFINNVWIEQTTDDKEGNDIKQKLKDSLRLDETFLKVKQKYEIVYKESKIKKANKHNKVILIVLIIVAIAELLILL